MQAPDRSPNGHTLAHGLKTQKRYMFSFRQGHASIFVPPPVVGPKHLRPFSPQFPSTTKFKIYSRTLRGSICPGRSNSGRQTVDAHVSLTAVEQAAAGPTCCGHPVSLKVLTVDPLRAPDFSSARIPSESRACDRKIKHDRFDARIVYCLQLINAGRPTAVLSTKLRPVGLSQGYQVAQDTLKQPLARALYIPPINNHCARFSSGTTVIFIYNLRVPFKLTPHKLLSKHFNFVGQYHFYMYMQEKRTSVSVPLANRHL